MTSNPPNPFLSIVAFLVLTVAYFAGKYVLQTKKMDPKYLLGCLITYMGCLIIS